MGKKFHTGSFIENTLNDHKKVKAKVAEGAGMSPQNLNDLFGRPSVPDDQLARLSKSSGLDLLGMVYTERSKETGFYKEPGAPSKVSEPTAPPMFNPNSPFQVVLTFDPDDDQLPKKMEQIRRIMKQK